MNTQNQDISFLIKRVNDSLSKFTNSHINNAGMSFSQIRVITYLKEHQGERCAQKDIEAFFGLSHPTVVGIIQRLEERGYIKSTVDSDDRRIKNLSLTKQGETLMVTAQQKRAKIDEVIVRNMSKEEVEQLRSLLTRVLDNL